MTIVPPRYAMVAALAATLALSVCFASPLARVVPIVRINVQWQPGTSPEAMDYTARRLSLYLIRPDGADVWVCMLGDRSPANIAALFSSPAINGIVGLNRETGQPIGFERVDPFTWIGYRYPALKTSIGFDANRLVRRAGLLPLFAACLLIALMARRPGRDWLVERVPPISPLAMGLFRVALTIGWALAVMSIPETRPGLRATSLALLVPFGLGVFPRLALAALALLWLPGATHDTAMPAKTLLLLALVPWADGLSVSEAIRRRRGRETSPEARRVYGLAIWIPVAMMGLAYLAAAFAKLDETGIRWVTDGVVRYFFIVDAPNAPSDLGRFVAASDGLSVLLAAGAVLTEACIIVGALYPRPLVVLAAGLGALALHEGFWLFQGVWWPAWWALLPAFVPWTLVARWLERSTTSTQWVTNDSRPIVDGVPLATAAILGLVVFQQPVVSLLRVEHRPLFSDFSMYSDSQWVSKQDFAAYMDRERRPDYPAVRLTGAGETDPAVIEARLRDVDPEKVVIDAARLVAGGIVPDETRRERVRAIGERYQERFGAPMLPLQIASASWHFDWSVADFAPNAAWQPSGVLEASAKP